MPFSRRNAALVALVVPALVVLVATRAAGAQLKQLRTEASAPIVHPAPNPRVAHLSGNSAGSGDRSDRPPSVPSGNVAVNIPVVPRPAALLGLCTAFLASDEHGREGTAFQILVGATGGSPTATATWCQSYLAPGQHRQSPEPLKLAYL